MKRFGKVLLQLIQGVLMAFGLISILYAVWMQIAERLGMVEREMFDEDFESDFSR